MRNRNWIKILPLFALSAAVALSPSFSAGRLPGGREIELRLEDILIFVLGLVWVLNIILARRRAGKAPLLYPILAWLGLSLISTFTNVFLEDLASWRGFFYFLKILEFVVFYLYFFFTLKKLRSVKLIVNFWIILAVLNAAYVFYQALCFYFGAKSFWRFGEYGTAALSEWGVFPTGSFFLILFIFLFNVFIHYFLETDLSKTKKILLGVAVISPAMGVFGSCSKTSFLAFILAFLCSAFFSLLKKRSFRLYAALFLSLLLIIVIFTFIFKTVPDAYRLLDVFSPEKVFADIKNGRIGQTAQTLSDNSPGIKGWKILLGAGRGRVEEAHNQFARDFIEIGVAGTVAFLALVALIFKRALSGVLKGDSNFSVGLSSGLFTATLAMLFCSLATEPFIVVKTSEVYWIFVALAMAALTIKENYAR